VLAIEPAHGLALARLDPLFEAEQRWEELAAQLEKQLKGTRDEREQLRLRKRLGLIKGTYLGNIEEAVRAWMEILRRNPGDTEALEALRKIYRAGSRWDDLVGVLRKLIPLQVDAEGVKAVRFELAEVFLKELKKRDEAIESAKRVLDVEPHTIPELVRLEALFTEAGAYNEAVKVMNLHVELAEYAGQKAEVLFAIAGLYETKLARRAGAAAAYEKVLAIESHSTKAYDALAAIYEAGGEYRKLVELHNRRLDSTEEAEERRRLLYAIIDIQERRLGQKELGFTAACRAFAEEGADPSAQTIAERLAEETEAWDVLVEVFEEQADSVPTERAVELRRRLAEIYVDKLEDPGRAERQLDLVLALRPSDGEARRQMARLLSEAARWRDLVNLTLDQVELSESVEDKKLHLREIAQIEEARLEELDAAIDTTRRVRELDPSDARTLDDLARLLRKAEHWRPLIDVLVDQASFAKTDAERVARRFDVALVLEEKLQEDDDATHEHREILLLDPNHVPSLQALERLYEKAGRYDALNDVLERQVRLTENDQAATTLLTRVAMVFEEHFKDLDSSAATLIRILEIDPNHLPTIKSLERVFLASGSWTRLVEALERHLELIEDTDQIVALYLQIGKVQHDELSNLDKSEDAYVAALEYDPDAKEALYQLGLLYEETGNWTAALEMLSREAALIGGDAKAVLLWFRAGNIHENMLMDRESAKADYAKALNIDPGYSRALHALADLYREDENWDEVLILEVQEAEETEESEPKGKLFEKAAQTALDKLQDTGEAIKLFERAIAAAPRLPVSLRALSDLYFGAEEWQKAEKTLEGLVPELDARSDKEELCRSYYRLAYIAEKLGDDESSRERYLRSYEIDSTYLPTLEGLAAALIRAQRWDDAQRIFQTILVHHRESLTDAEVVDLYFQLGEIGTKLDDLDRAKKSFDRALELDPNHTGTLRAYAELSERLEEWEEAYDHRARLIDLLRDEDRFVELTKQARLCAARIQDPYRAIDAYSEARRMRPDEEEVLAALGKLYRETSQHPRAIETLRDLVSLLVDPEKKRDVLLEIASIHHDERGDWQRAVDTFNEALDADPKCVSAFQRIEGILAKQKQWAALEHNYRRMIERLPKDNSQKMARVVLWRSLGDLYQKALDNPEGARTAFEVVLKMKPDEHAVTAQLADLLAKRRETAHEAVKLYHKLVPVVDDPSGPVRQLYGLYMPLKMPDRALCALGALVLMRVASADELKAYDLLLKRLPQGTPKPLSDKLWWSYMFHPDTRSPLGEILSVLYRGAPQLFGEAQAALRLGKRELVDLQAKGKNARAGLQYFNIWNKLASVMQVGEMAHYHRPGIAMSPRLYPGLPPALVAGEQHEVFKELPARQIAWLLSRQMATARPEFAPVRALTPEDAAAAIEGAIRLFAPEGSGITLTPPLDKEAVQAWQRALQRTLTERAVKALRPPVQACLEKQELKRLPQFLEGIEHTASRAAMLLSTDARIADRGLNEADGIVEMPHRRRARALMLFLLSDDFFQVREEIGLAIPKG
jgi:tetratricopeptide (TPR) repeat protein